jgi:hypothetical protein
MSVTIGVWIVPGQTAFMRMPTRGVFQRGALGESDDAVLGGVIRGTARQSDEPAERGAVDDGAAALRAHLTQLVLHAGPDAALVDRGDAVEVLGRLFGGVRRRDHDAGVVEGHVEPAEGVHRAVDEGGDLGLVGHVAGDAERLMTGGGQLVGGGAEPVLVDVGEHDSGAGCGEGLGGVTPHARAGAGDDGDLVAKVVGWVHCLLPRGSAGRPGCCPRGDDHGLPLRVVAIGHGRRSTLIASRWSMAR